MLFRKIAQALPGINGNSMNDQKDQSKNEGKRSMAIFIIILILFFKNSAKNQS